MKLQQKVAAAAAALENTHRQLTRLTGESSYWEGDAAEKFRDALDGDLPKYIKDAASSLRAAATHLHQWDGHLTSNRELAKKYDAAMAEKKAAADKAKNSYDQAAQHPDLKLANQTFPSQEEADAATARLRSAERELNEASVALTKANGEYESLDGKVKALEAEHTTEAETIAKALDGSTKAAPDEPGFWDKVGDVISGVWEFLKTHAGTIGAVAGLLALLPTPFAPLFCRHRHWRERPVHVQESQRRGLPGGSDRPGRRNGHVLCMGLPGRRHSGDGAGCAIGRHGWQGAARRPADGE
ncbi:hypothetical protein O3S80_21185 [Streptomyces sp. Lzd4kr]|nr:hypothetical protein [Streptomyces sp. Lzd4kr]